MNFNFRIIAPIRNDQYPSKLTLENVNFEGYFLWLAEVLLQNLSNDVQFIWRGIFITHFC